MNLHFSDEPQRNRFFRTWRLVHDDCISYAQAAAPYCAINSQAENTGLIDSLNKNGVFWNCVLASLQSTAIIAIARLHDKSKQKNHLAQLLQILEKQSPSCVQAAKDLALAVDSQRIFINSVLELRNRLFAHTDVDAPVIAAFGFKDLTIQGFRDYWNALVGALASCDDVIFGAIERGPKFDPSIFGRIELDTLQALGVTSEA